MSAARVLFEAYRDAGRSPLQAYLTAARFRLFGYGGELTDCLTWAADWAVLRGWPDPAAAFRGRYDGSAEAARIVARAGGLVALARAGCKAAFIPEIDPLDPRPGDIGVGHAGATDWDSGDVDTVAADYGHPVGLIRAGAFWASFTRAGVVIGPAVMLAAWRV